MDSTTLLEAFARDSERLQRAGETDLTAVVPTCDGWVVQDVLRHTGRVYRSVEAIVRTRSQEIVPAEQTPSGPKGPAVIEWFAEGRTALHTALADLDPDTVLWTWAGLLPAMFYFRRMAHETAIHCYDAAAAFGNPALPASDLGVDGVDEYLERVLPFALQRWDAPLPSGSLHLHRTDGIGEWLVRTDDHRLMVTKEHAKGDVAVKGSGGALFLFIWNRRGIDDLEVFGDTSLATAWAALAP